MGRVEPGVTVAVDQHFHLDEMTGNAYQGDKLTFTVTYYAEQLDAPGPASTANGVVLENKNASGNWAPIVNDGIWGLLTWDSSGNYRVRAWNLAGTQYDLRAWDYPTDSHIAWFGENYTTSDVDDTGNYSGFARPQAKYWLQENSGSWDHSLTLWEANLVN